jgi:hypothetical protein
MILSGSKTSYFGSSTLDRSLSARFHELAHSEAVDEKGTAPTIGKIRRSI